MRALIALPVILAIFALPAFGQQAALFDELVELYPDTDPARGEANYEGDTPKGVPAGVHLIVRRLVPGRTLGWKLLEGGHPIAEATAFRMIAVPVEQNTGLVSRTEVFEQKQNPHVIRRAPFRVFEVLEPIGAGTTVDDSGIVCLRIEVPVGAEAGAGVREYQLVLESGEWSAALEWTLTVHDVSVPPVGSRSPGYTNWFSLGAIAQRHQLELWSEPYWTMLGRYADLMARGRQNTFWIRWRDFLAAGDDAVPRLDRARLERYLRLFFARGFTVVEGGHVAVRHQGDWGSGRLDFNLTGADLSGTEGKAALRDFLLEVKRALAQTEQPEGTAYLQHISDEPTNVNAAAYREVADLVREVLPDAGIFEATMSLELVGAVNHWCPQVQEYQQHQAFFETRKQSGDTVWVYTCLVPGGPWINRLLDQERLRQVYVGWSLFRYDLAGFLHWGFNHYRSDQDPFAKSVVPHGKGPPNFLPAGDTHVVYPGKDDPLSGHRFEAHRIGMEDAELLLRLKEVDPARAEQLCGQVFRAYDDFETDVRIYRSVRRQLLHALTRAGTAAEAAEESAREEPQGGPTVDRLAWMAGHWQGRQAGVFMEEFWLPPRGGLLVGLHRDVPDSSGPLFEYLRIETREDGLYYLASPRGREATPFKLSELSSRRVVFENPEHDFPQRIIYWLDNGGGTLHARIEGDQGGTVQSSEWAWRRSSGS